MSHFVVIRRLELEQPKSRLSFQTPHDSGLRLHGRCNGGNRSSSLRPRRTTSVSESVNTGDSTRAAASITMQRLLGTGWDGVYEPIGIETLVEGRFRCYSEAMGLYVCWEEGKLRFFDPCDRELSSHP